jgi:hypothetical protein
VAADRRIIVEDAPSTSADVHSKSSMRSTVSARQARVAEDEFAHLPVLVRRSTAGARVRVWRTGDGQWWRQGGMVRVQKWPAEGGRRMFVVTLFKGANVADVRFLLDLVEWARHGEGFPEVWAPLEADWADDLTFSTGSASRSYTDPYTHLDNSPDAVACEEPLCPSTWHSEYEDHVLDEAYRQSESASWEIRIRRPAEGSVPWSVSVHVVDFDGSPTQVAELVNDLQWMQAECDRANMPVGEVA